jgi:hypothetical protein
MDTLQSIAAAVGRAFEPLVIAFSAPRRAEHLLNALGWQLPPGVQDLGLGRLDVAGLVQKVSDLRAAVSIEGDGSGASIQLSADVLSTLNAVLNAFTAFSNGLNATLPADYLARTNIQAELPRRLIDFLVIEQLRLSAAPFLTVLTAAGLVRFEPHDADPANFVTAHVRHIVDYGALATTITDTTGRLKQVFAWGSSSFDPGRMLLYLGLLLHALGGIAELRPLARAIEERLSGHSMPEADTAPGSHLIMTLRRAFAFQDLKAGVALLGLRATTPGGADAGFAISPFVRGTADRSFSLSDSLSFEIDTTADLAAGCVVSFRPGQPPKIQTGVATDAPVGTSAVDRVALSARYRRADAKPVTILAVPGGSHLDLYEFSLTLGVDAAATGLSPLAECGLKGLQFHLKGVASDGFLAKVLPSSLDGSSDLTIGWSGTGGIHFAGSSALEVQLPLHLSLGPVDLDALTLSIAASGGSFPAALTCNLKAALGPLGARIEGLGIKATFSFAADMKGNLGPLDLQPGFVPPTGVGLSLDTGVIQGGGFLSIDSARGQYAGVLQLVIADFLNVTAIGLIETKLPDGSEGFSLLIILTADFGAGIQLGFGFTLLAVGGLVGLNRGMLFQPILDAIRTNAISSVAFPQNVVANATRIISDLQAFFPPQQGTFLIGPMAKIGWGEPTLASLSLGVIIEIPPGDIAILGIIRLALPADQEAILVLQVNFAGVIEADKQRIYFYAALFDSHVLFITIDGSMGLLVAYGTDANFIVSVGGFHPQFHPPPLPFPTPQRISLNLINESFARIHADGYFAVTSNTVQFGTHSNYFFGFSALNVQGASSFDALIQFSPFHFIVSFSTSFSVNVFGVGCYGIDIALTVDGPTPFHASGTASISFFFFSVGIHIDLTWGESRDTTLPPVAVMPLLTAELGKQTNWRAVLPSGNTLLVSLRHLDAAEAALVLHPVGMLQISQRLVPLGLTLDKFGSQKPSDANFFTLDVTSPGLGKTRNLQEEFAPSQFQNFSDAQKLSQPGYVPLDSGIELAVGGVALASGTAITRNVRYDLTIIDTKLRRVFFRFFIFTGTLFRFFLNGGSVTRSPLSAYQQAQRQPFEGTVMVSPETFAVAFTATNKLYQPEAAAFTSQAAANDYVARTVVNAPTLAGKLHVLPQFELTA